MKVTFRKHFLDYNSRRQKYLVSWTESCVAEINACESFRMASLVFKFSFTACLSSSEVSDSDFEN